MAAPQGVEPRYAAPEAAVLPLNEGATRAFEGRELPLAWVPGWRQAQQANLFIISGFAQWVKRCRRWNRSSYALLFQARWVSIVSSRRHPRSQSRDLGTLFFLARCVFHRESRNHPG